MQREGNAEQAIRMPGRVHGWSPEAARMKRGEIGSGRVHGQPRFAGAQLKGDLAFLAFLRGKLRCFERGALTRRYGVHREFLDCLVEKAMKIELCGKVQEHRAEANGGAVHEHEFAGNPHRPFFLEGAMNPEGLAPAVFGGLDAMAMVRSRSSSSGP